MRHPLYIRSADVEGFRGIRQVIWQVDANKLCGWHIVLGDNAAGKTSFLRGLSLALLGPEEAGKAFPAPGWVNASLKECRIAIRLRPQDERPPERVAVLRIRDIRGSVEISADTGQDHVDGVVWSSDISQIPFSVGFGSLRRMQGSNEELSSLIENNSQLSRHQSLIFDNLALTRFEQWIETIPAEGNQGFTFQVLKHWLEHCEVFPQKVQISRDKLERPRFRIAGGSAVTIRDLSDGYQSMLCILLDILFRLSLANPPSKIFERDRLTVATPGIALIDEIDAHLHPNWQRSVGDRLCKLFPRFQWIVATHSPFIAQSPRTNSILSLDRPQLATPHMVSESEFNEIVYGDVLDAYAARAFGLSSDRSDQSEELLRELSRMNYKEMRRPLTSNEESRRELLRSMFPHSRTILPFQTGGRVND